VENNRSNSSVEHSTDLVAMDPDADLVERYMKSGGKGHRIGQVALSYDKDANKAREFALRFKFGVSGWKVMSELPNPVNFDASTENVTIDDLSGSVATGPDPRVHIEAVKKFVNAGFDEVCVVQVGDDKDGFMQFWADELAPELAHL
jgi:hypothetical protein